jgi:hypothetical protein
VTAGPPRIPLWWVAWQRSTRPASRRNIS